MLESTNEILWWQWWLLIAISINTTINLIVFFRGRKLHIREFLLCRFVACPYGDKSEGPRVEGRQDEAPRRVARMRRLAKDSAGG